MLCIPNEFHCMHLDNAKVSPKLPHANAFLTPPGSHNTQIRVMQKFHVPAWEIKQCIFERPDPTPSGGLICMCLSYFLSADMFSLRERCPANETLLPQSQTQTQLNFSILQKHI